MGACLAATRYPSHPSKGLKGLCIIFTFTCLLLAAFLLFQPWDEAFIFLRHSLHLAEAGNFSFNRASRIEGIVDFLPYFCLGLLHKTGLPLLETNFFLGVLGGGLCILAGRQILLAMGFQEIALWSFPLLLVYPPLLLNLSNGFPVLLFSASLFWSIIFLYFRRSWWFGCFLLSLVPLVRIEGLWFCILLLGIVAIKNRIALSPGKLFLGLLLVFLPASLLTLWRWSYFGNPIPVPVLYKSAFGNLFYSLFGLRNLLMDLTATGALLFFWSIFQRKDQRGSSPDSMPLGMSLFVFSLPYYFSGGDWFPSAWARYLFPFAFFVFLEGLTRLFSKSNSKLEIKNPAVFSFLILAVMILFLPFGSVPKLWQELFSHRSTLAGLHRKKGGQSNYRIQQLSQLGTHLSLTTNGSDIIGSSELATIMFFAKRDCLDLLGLTNREIAKAPLRSTPKLFSKLQPGNELPYLIFKRTHPEVLLKYRPGIFYAFDFFLRDLLKKEDLRNVTHEDLLSAWIVWNDTFSKMNTTLFGGVENLLNAGYTPVIVNYHSSFYALYFVSNEIRQSHFDKMLASGMRLTVLKSNHL